MEIQILHLLEGARQARGLTVIIDVFRAFSVEAYLLGNNAQKVLPVGEISTALEYRRTHPEAILCGERGGKIIEGFDFGNCPTDVEKLDLTGKTVVHTTSAGTQGVVNAAGAEEILGGSLVTAGAIAKYIQKKNPRQVSLVCMGLAGKRTTDEDELCALYIKSLLEGAPLPDLAQRIEHLKLTDGAKFFAPEKQSVFPESDFYLCTQVSKFPFVLRLGRDPETGWGCMEKITV